MKTLRIKTVERIRSPHPRGGTTLTEVLMSLMIMSIGIVSVATLFPLSTLRVLEASRQTNSTITRFSAEAAIDVDAGFLHNPDGVDGYNSRFVRGQVYFVDPYGYQTFHRDTSLTGRCPAGPNGEDNNGNGTLDPNEDRNGNGNLDVPLALRDTWGALPSGSTVNVLLPRRYTGATMFSSVGINPYPGVGLTPANLANSDLAINRAAQWVGQPDNWKLITTTEVTTSATPVPGITSLSLDTDADLTAVSVSPGVAYRAVIFDLSGQYSETRLLAANPIDQTLAFTPALPSRFDTSPTGVSPNVGKVRIEVLDEVYTWAMSVRKRTSGPANVDVVVFFKRSFKLEHEYVYPAALRRYTLGPDGVPGTNLPIPDGPPIPPSTSPTTYPNGDDNKNGVANDVGEIGYVGSDDAPNTIVTVDFSSLPAGDATPGFRRGGYVCDTKNGLWYRIQAIQNATTTTVDLVLDKFIQRDNTEDLFNFGTVDAGEDVNNDNIAQLGGLYWNPSVVNVFPLEIKEP